MTTLLADDPATTAGNNVLPLSMVERMTLIMEAFDRPLSRLTLDEVTRHTGLPRSTAHRILDQLVQCSWLVHSKTHYSLGSRALTLGGREIAQHELRSAASRALQSLAMRTGAGVQLVTLVGSEVYYLDAIGGPHDQRRPSVVGGRSPAHCTAAGKAILAGLSPEYVDNQYSHSFLRGCTERSTVDLNDLHYELARIRARNGVAVERGEYLRGLSCVAAAVRNSDEPVGAISVVTGQDKRLEMIAPLVLRAARAITDKLTGGF